MTTNESRDPEIRLTSGDAVLLVDPQNDFCPGGSLAVPHGDEVMPVLNRWAAAAMRSTVPLLVSRDWHPPRTTHFDTDGGVWPPHCVAGTRGAAFHPDLHLPPEAIVVSKGTRADEDAYSAFQARDDQGHLVPEILRSRGTRRLWVLGLATDYCVKATAVAARTNGFDVNVIAEGKHAVNVHAGDDERAWEEMRAAGATILSGDVRPVYPPL